MANSMLSITAISLALLSVSGGVFGNVLRINTPELYRQFVDEEIECCFINVAIVPGAHPDIMSLPQKFANYTDYDQFRFYDDKVNSVILTLEMFSVLFIWSNGKDYTQSLPAHYTYYSIVLSKRVSLSDSDYNNVFNWKEMTRLQVDDENNFAYDLSQRVAEMKSLQLSYLKLKLQRHSYKELKVKTFLEQLPKLVSLELDTHGLTRAQIKSFVELQEVPDNFSVKLYSYSVKFVRVN